MPPAHVSEGAIATLDPSHANHRIAPGKANFQCHAPPYRLPASLPFQVGTWRVRKVMPWPVLPFEPELRHIYIEYLYTVYEL